MIRHTTALATLLGALLWPAAALRAQPTPPQPVPPTEESARDAVRAAMRRAEAVPDEPEVVKIKDEGLKRSKVMETLGYLSDVIGPRLTGSPNLKRANEWTRDTMAKWGLKNAHLEPWGPFGRGWSLKRFSAQVVEPQCIPLIAYPRAWSPGTSGPVTAEVVHLDVKKDSDFDKYKGKLRGKIVLAGNVRELKAHFEAPGRRLDDTRLLELADAPEPRERAGGRRRGPMGPDSPFFQLMQMAQKRAKFLVEEGAAVIIDSSRSGDGGTIFTEQAAVPGALPFGMGGPGRRIGPWDKDAPKLVPQVTCSNEQFNRMVRMLQAGEALKMTVDLDVAFHDEDPMAYNTIAEIPGTDLKDEVVMLGGHMDSWHSGTGATDNGAGVAVAMEAARILMAAGLKPRRTVRVGLWSGEEQGLLGSRAYVKEHFGSRDEDPALAAYALIWGQQSPAPKLQTKPEYDRFCAYFNLDNGTGKVRGVYMEGNEAVRPLFRRWLTPFRDTGARTLTLSRTGGTDHMSFDGIGLPGFQFIQDPVEYETRTHHSNQDVFDRIQGDDLKQASVVMATFVYKAATLDRKLPRKEMAPPRSEEGPTRQPIAAAP